MNTVQGYGVRIHAPEPLQGMATVPELAPCLTRGRLVNVAHPRLAGQACNGRIVRQGGQGGAVDDVTLNRPQTDGYAQHRAAQILYAAPGDTVHGAEFANQGRQTRPITALPSLGQARSEQLAAGPA